MKQMSRIAWKYVTLAPLTIILSAAFLGLSLRWYDYNNPVPTLRFIAVIFPLLSYLALIIAASEGRMLGKRKWLPLLQIIEFPVLIVLFSELFASQQITGEGGWGPVIYIAIGGTYLITGAIVSYPLAFYFQARQQAKKPIGKWLWALIAIAFVFFLLLFLA